MTSFTTSLRHVARRLLAAPLFTAIAVVTLGVGIGATVAIFSLVHGVLLKPLPFAEPDRLVGLWHEAPGLDIGELNQSPATYFTYREQGRVFEDVGLWATIGASVTGVAEPEQVLAIRVTDGTLPLLGVQPVLGRTFSSEDDSPGSPETVILSHGYWQRKFGGAPDIVGQLIRIDGRPREIVGVLPASFRFLDEDPSLYLPFRLDREEVFFGNFSQQGIARLKPGVTMAQANADVARMIPLSTELFPLPPGMTVGMIEDARLGPLVRPLADDVIGDVGRVLWVLLGTVGIVLLIACANVANLFLVRAESRQQELAIRSALGAGRGRVAGELLSESVVLGLLGGALGVGVAWAAIRVLHVIGPEGLPRIEEVGLDPLVLLVAFGLSVAAGMIFGGVAVLRTGSSDRLGALKEGGRGGSDGPQRQRVRTALVTAEIAMALVLLVAAGLMVRTFQSMREVDPGYVRPGEVLTFRVTIPRSVIEDQEQAVRTLEAIGHELEGLAGVTSVGMTSSVTMDGFDNNDPIFVEEFPESADRLPPLRRFKRVSPGVFATLGQRLVAGRTFDWTDNYEMRRVVMISESLAREYWASPAEAIGKRVRESPENPWREIIGVVSDERDDGVVQPPPTVVYWPLVLADYWDDPVSAQRSVAYVVRTPRAGTEGLLREIQAAVWSVNGNLPLALVRTLAEIEARSMAQTSFALALLAAAAFIALLISVVGIYGVIAYAASQRTREIGIRIALGARREDVRGLFVRHGLVLTGLGVLIGVGAALVLTRLMSSLLFGISPLDPVTFAAVSAGLAATALLASYVPARRAARLDPVAALRADA